MSGKMWAAGNDNPFGDAPDDDGYQPWRGNPTGNVRDLAFVPAPGSGEPQRGESYLQVISWELSEDETELCLMCHTSGQLVLIAGQGLGELKDQISAKRVQTVHVWSQAAHGPKPAKVVTGLRFDKTFGALMNK